MLELIVLQVQKLLAIDPSFPPLDDSTLSIFAEQAYNEALGYCNVKELPKEAANTIALMVMDVLKALGKGAVSSITEGGRSVSFKSLDGVAVKEDRKKALDLYRKARAL